MPTSAADSGGEQVYESCVREKVSAALAKGQDMVVWSYGAKGSGKTSVLGFGGAKDDAASPPRGVAHCLCDNLFNELVRLKQAHDSWVSYEVSASFLSVGTLLEQCVDCLSTAAPPANSSSSSSSTTSSSASSRRRSRGEGSSMNLREDPKTGFYLEGLTSVPCTSAEELADVFMQGVDAASSSPPDGRAHNLFMVTVLRTSTDGTEYTSQLKLLDLAGHVRPESGAGGAGAKGAAAKSGGTPAQKRAAAARGKATVKEDRTLKAVSRVVSAIYDARSHVPHRDAKMTRLVKEGFGGRASAVMLLCVRSGEEDYDETNAMFTFMQHVRAIRNRPRENSFNLSSAILAAQQGIGKLEIQVGGWVRGLRLRLELDLVRVRVYLIISSYAPGPSAVPDFVHDPTALAIYSLACPTPHPWTRTRSSSTCIPRSSWWS